MLPKRLYFVGMYLMKYVILIIYITVDILKKYNTLIVGEGGGGGGVSGSII